MTRHIAAVLGAAIALWALPTIARANGEFCVGHPTTIFGTLGSDSPATGFDGTPGHEVMFAFRGNDTVDGEGGNDILCGSKGDDSLDGQSEGDELYGQGGNDRILGSSGRDVAYGSEGNDSVGGGNGADLVHGGSGADELRGGPQADAIYGGTGDDLLVSANGGIDHVLGEGGIDTCRVDAFDVVESCEVIDLVP
jgi:Ca2+-binding RTX toxin-like protein